MPGVPLDSPGMVEDDPLFTSIFIANLGSIGYPAGFHHLWEYGTASIFGVMGKIEPGATLKVEIPGTNRFITAA